jgi:hypothetical protein
MHYAELNTQYFNSETHWKRRVCFVYLFRKLEDTGSDRLIILILMEWTRRHGNFRFKVIHSLIYRQCCFLKKLFLFLSDVTNCPSAVSSLQKWDLGRTNYRKK